MSRYLTPAPSILGADGFPRTQPRGPLRLRNDHPRREPHSAGSQICSTRPHHVLQPARPAQPLLAHLGSPRYATVRSVILALLHADQSVLVTGIIEDAQVRELFSKELTALREAFEVSFRILAARLGVRADSLPSRAQTWKPQTKTLKEVKLKLEGIRMLQRAKDGKL